MKRLRVVVALALVAALAWALASCSGGDRMQQLKDATGRVDLTAAEAQQLLAQDDVRGVVIFDVRDQPEFAQGHIVNAYSVEVNSPGFGAALEGFSKKATYLVYGDGPDDGRPGSAADQMVAYGIGKVYVITDGYSHWKGDTATS
ncbi:MAG: rhodanese-like domain-containing protein [Propionibacteriaceae bacterium]|jgi:rhodanese-related sulfurtransferase|nr:rhodanese-like domain-containing protein [Propionibacteriaceae bacterium]